MFLGVAIEKPPFGVGASSLLPPHPSGKAIDKPPLATVALISPPQSRIETPPFFARTVNLPVLFFNEIPPLVVSASAVPENLYSEAPPLCTCSLTLASLGAFTRSKVAIFEWPESWGAATETVDPSTASLVSSRILRASGSASAATCLQSLTENADPSQVVTRIPPFFAA